MGIVNSQVSPDRSQGPVRCIEECISAGIVMWSDPFPFHYPPKRLGNVQMRGIRRNVEQKESPFFPNGTHLPDFSISMYAGIIEHDKCLFLESERESISG
jgi:hypothetical protein